MQRNRGLVAFSLTFAVSAASAACSTSAENAAPVQDTTDAGADGGIPLATAVAAIPLSASTSCTPISYALSATIGGSQTFDLQLDTASATLGVAASACASCGDAGISPLYAPGASAVDEHQQGSSQYEVGGWSGEIYQDNVTLLPAAAAPVKLVAISTQNQFFTSQGCAAGSGAYQGIIGFALAGSELPGTNGYFDQFVAATQAPNIFATELCPSGGMLWLGGYDSTFTTAAPQYTPMVTTTNQYAGALDQIALTSISIGGVVTPVASTAYPTSVLDTATPTFQLLPAAFAAVRQAIAADAQFQSIFAEPASWFAPNGYPLTACKALSQTKAELDAALPPMTLTFGSGPSIDVQAVATESYLSNYEYKGQSLWCPAIAQSAADADYPFAAVMGAPVLQSNVVIIDRENQRVGFAPHTACK